MSDIKQEMLTEILFPSKVWTVLLNVRMVLLKLRWSLDWA